MILSAIFVILCLCDICCYVDKKQIRRLGRLVEPSGIINNHTERPLRARNQSKMSHFVATVWFTSVNKVRVCIIISLFLFTKGTLYFHSGFEKFEKEKSEITMKFSLFKIMIFGKFLGEFFRSALSFFGFSNWCSKLSFLLALVTESIWFAEISEQWEKIWSIWEHLERDNGGV